MTSEAHVAATSTDAVRRANLIRREQRLRARGWMLRVAMAVAFVVGTALVAPDQLTTYGYVVAFGWVPTAAAVDAWRRRSLLSGWPRNTAAAVDAALLLFTSALVPELLAVVLLSQLTLATYHLALKARAGPWSGWGPNAVVASLVVALAAPGVAETTVAMIGMALALAGIAWLDSERRLAEHTTTADLHTQVDRHEALLRGVGEAVLVTGPGGRIRSLNPGAEATFACPAETAKGTRCHEILGLRRGLAELDCSHGCPLVSNGHEGSDQEVWRSLPTGLRQPLLATAVPVRDEDGRTIEVLHSFRDITQLKLAEEAKSLFLATASHELKTPLAIIRGFAGMLVDRGPEILERDELIRALQTIDTRAQELDRIVDRILMSAKIGAGNVDLVLEHRDVSHDLGTQARNLGQAVGREILVRVPDTAPSVLVSATAVETILDHYVENAVKYSPDGDPVTVDLQVEPTEVVLAVTDAGIGMTPEQAGHCFDQFWQAEPSDVRRFGGTGIGLHIVRSLAEAMGCRVGVDSTPGEGSTFWLAMPRSDAPVEESSEEDLETTGRRTMIEEFMRQVGVSGGGAAGRSRKP